MWVLKVWRYGCGRSVNAVSDVHLSRCAVFNVHKPFVSRHLCGALIACEGNMSAEQ